MRTHTAALVWTGPGRAFGPGAVTVDDGGRVVHIGPTRAALDYEVLVPGLVDAHIHAQIPALSSPVREFVPWLRAVIASRGEKSDPVGHTRRRILAGLHRGTTAFGEIDSIGTTPAVLRELARDGFEIGGRCYQELLGFDADRHRSGELVAARAAAATRRCPSGLSPHAPYSVSSDLLRTAVRRRVPLMAHVAESVEEVEFLRCGRGPLRDLLRDLDRLPAGFRPRDESPIDWLARGGALGSRAALVHCQHLAAGDAERIAAAGASIVVCPGTIRFFRRDPPPLADWLRAGIAVAIGTDSLASNELGGDMLAELAAARELWPGVAPESLLACATRNGARALSRPGIGGLRVGAAADMLAIEISGDPSVERVTDVLTSGRPSVRQVWLRGQPVLTRSA